MRQIAKALDRPLEVIPARYSAVRADLINLHEVPAGLTAKTLQNHKSNAKGALLYLAREKGVPEHGAPLTPEWEALEGEDRGLAGALPPVVLHALLLGERRQARRGERERRRAVHRLPLPVRQACRYGLPAPDGAGLECQCGDDRRLAGQPSSSSRR